MEKYLTVMFNKLLSLFFNSLGILLNSIFCLQLHFSHIIFQLEKAIDGMWITLLLVFFSVLLGLVDAAVNAASQTGVFVYCMANLSLGGRFNSYWHLLIMVSLWAFSLLTLTLLACCFDTVFHVHTFILNNNCSQLYSMLY